MKCCINGVNFIRLLLLSTVLFKFEIQKYGQILCVHKPYFLMPGHIFDVSLCKCVFEFERKPVLPKLNQLNWLLQH